MPRIKIGDLEGQTDFSAVFGGFGAGGAAFYYNDPFSGGGLDGGSLGGAFYYNEPAPTYYYNEPGGGLGGGLGGGDTFAYYYT